MKVAAKAFTARAEAARAKKAEKAAAEAAASLKAAAERAAAEVVAEAIARAAAEVVAEAIAAENAKTAAAKRAVLKENESDEKAEAEKQATGATKPPPSKVISLPADTVGRRRLSMPTQPRACSIAIR